MKLHLFTGLLLSSLLCTAQQHYTINWAQTPKNPIAFNYTANHFALQGKVKSVTESWDNMSFYRAFLENGFLQNTLYKLGGTETNNYTYNLPEGLILKEQEDAGRKIVFTQTLNEKNQLTESSYSSDQKYRFSYNDKGLFSEKEYPSKAILKYEYNAAGQLNKEENYREGNLTSLITYTYAQVNGQLVVTCTTEYKTSGDKYAHKEFYNANGLLVKEITADEERTFSYQLDASGNWISRTTVFKNLKTKSIINRVITRKIVYYQ